MPNIKFISDIKGFAINNIVAVNNKSVSNIKYVCKQKWAYHYIAFTEVGSHIWTIPEEVPDLIDVLIVAGGGGGGHSSPFAYGGGGGGAGGLILLNNYNIKDRISIPLTVGDGGAGGVLHVGSKGKNSIFDTDNITIGGGGGGRATQTVAGAPWAATSGGSGGGGGDGAFYSARFGADGIEGQGNNGGDAPGTGTHGGSGGGGGGKSSMGFHGLRGGNVTAGGIGLNVWDSVYATGGQGGACGATMLETTPGEPNTGNGGGGGRGQSSQNGFPGGSGIILIRYIY